MSENYVKKYDVGQIKLDLPYANFIHELPLLSFGDVQNTFSLSLIFQSKLTTNPFYIANGYKLSIQKRIIISNGTPQSYEEGNGTLIKLNYCYGNKYAFDDGSQRFIRLINGQYVLENPDYSTEIFDTNGNVLFVKDKYGNSILRYEYSSEKLTSVIFKENKTVNFNYAGDSLDEIEYTHSNNTYLTTLDCSGNNVTVHHYSGVDYYMNYTSGYFEAYSPNYFEKLTVNVNGNSITVNRYSNNNTIDRMTYDYVDCIESGEANIIDITNFHNVTTRVQFANGKPSYSYEKLNNMFIENSATNNYYYPGKVTFYNNEKAIGSQGYGDDLKLKDISIPNTNYPYSFYLEQNLTGLMTLSGWLKPVYEETSECDITINGGNTVIAKQTIKGLKKDIWSYFSISFYAENVASITVVTSESKALIVANDFRLSFQANSNTNLEEYIDNLIKSSGVLIHTDNEGVETVIPITDTVEYINGASPISKINYPMTINDLMRFKINQTFGSNTGEIYYNDCRGAFAMAGAFYIKYRTPDGVSITASLNNLDIGKMYTIKSDVYVTKMSFYTENGATRIRIESWKNSNAIETKVYNEKFDLIWSSADNTTTEYRRNNKGLIESQVIDNSIQREAIYDDSCTKLLKTIDEFGVITTYTTNDTWGVITASTVDGTSVTDAFDGDCSTLKSRTFSKNEDSRTHLFSYEGGMISGLSEGTINYEFNYSGGDLSSIAKNGTNIETHTISNNRKTYTSTYGSHSVKEIYDAYGRLSEIENVIKNTYDVNPIYNSGYEIAELDNSNAKLAVSEDKITGNQTKYAYTNGNLSRVGVFNTNGVRINDEVYAYDNSGRLITDVYSRYIADTTSVESEIEYFSEEDSPSDNSLVSEYSYRIDGNLKARTENTYDDYKRIEGKKYTVGGKVFTKGIEYDKTRPSKLIEGFGNTTYDYDEMGRIKSINNGKPITYEYDSFGQLVRENNKTLDKTFKYEYNGIGNIMYVREYPYTPAGTELSGNPTTTTFAYNASKSDVLSQIGNQTVGFNANGGLSYYKRSYTWKDGKLKSFYRGSTMVPMSVYEECGYQYNAYGQRISKTYHYDPNTSISDDASYNYTKTYDYDHNGRLVREKIVQKHILEVTSTREIIYLYDESGMIGFTYSLNGATPQIYYYRRNLLGDVIGIYNTSGTKVVEYAYDAWGNCTIVYSSNNTLANDNPIRYRGYYLDIENNFYYLNSRYYSPELRRFISPDDTAYLDPKNVNGLNLYCYCNNDPVNYADPSGHLAVTTIAIIAGAFIGFGISATSSVITQLEEYNGDWSNINLRKVVFDGVFGAINGALAASGISVGWSVALGAASGFLSSIGSDILFENGNINWGAAVNSLIIGAVAARIAGAGANYAGDGMQVTKFANSRNILNRTIANGTKKAIARQSHALNFHVTKLLSSGMRYMLANTSTTVYTMFTN